MTRIKYGGYGKGATPVGNPWNLSCNYGGRVPNYYKLSKNGVPSGSMELPVRESPMKGGKSIKSRKSRKSRKSKKGGNPKKGMASKTRKGRKDYITHKGDKYYNRKGKRQTKNRKGRKGKPYSKRR